MQRNPRQDVDLRGDLAADAVAALGFVRAQPGVRADAVGLFGHSEGGWVVLRAATGRDDVPWVITNSCPGMAPAAQDRYALANVLRQTGGIDQRDIDAALACYDRVMEAGQRDIDFAHRATLTVEVFPGADHRVKTDGGTRLAAAYLGVLTQWINDRAAVGPDA